MSRVFRDVKEHIFEAAMSLFCENKYNNVDMKMIAQECGIAVGTLYNYYPNKKELYISIAETSWEKTFEKLHEIDKLSLSSGQKLKKCIEVLYCDIECRQGLIKELMKININDFTEDERIVNFKKTLLVNIENYIKSVEKLDVFKKSKLINTKITETLLVTITMLIEAHPQEKEENMVFINQMLNAFIKCE